MHTKIFALAIGLAFALLPCLAFTAPYGAELEERMARLAGSSKEELGPATTSILFKLVDSEGGERLLFDQESDHLVMPASTMKLFTGWMAMKKWARKDSYLSQMLRTSDNNMAQSTFTKMGGARKMLQFYTDLGLDMSPTRVTIADGSGLSKTNRSNCQLQVELLEHIHQSPEYNRFIRLLAKPGEAGTLVNRLHDYRGRLFAKTGTLNEIIALTGFIHIPQGKVLFCIISENFTNDWPTERARVDRILRERMAELEPAASESEQEATGYFYY